MSDSLFILVIFFILILFKSMISNLFELVLEWFTIQVDD